MLNLMRRFASTLAGKILGGLLLIGLAGFGISNVILDLGSNTLAKVGDEDITIQEFQRAYRQQLNQFAQQTGQMPTDQQAMSLGIPGSVLAKLSSDAAINQFAKAQGIGISDAKLGELVRNDPSFAGVLGTFEKGNFQQVLQQNGYTEAEYFELQTSAARRQQVATGLFAGTTVPKAGLDILNRYRNDKRTVEYFTLNSTSLASIPTPTDEDLAKYLKDNQTKYRTQETRTADIMVLTLDTLAALPDYQPTEDQIKAEYEATKQQLSVVEKRQVQQVVLSDPSKEQFFKAGTPFLDAVKAAGLTPTDFGLVAKTDLVDPSVADAAFGLAKEGDFTIIPGIGAKRVIGVTKIEAGGVPAYDTVKAQVAKTLAINKAKTAYADVQDQVEELRAAFKPLKDIAARFKLPVKTVALTADGAQLADVTDVAPENRQKLAAAVFAATQGKLAPTVAVSSNVNIYFDLNKVEAARDQTLAEVKDKLTTDWTNAKTDEALQAEVKAITADLDAGKSFQDVAAARSQFATISAPFTRDGDKTSVINQQVATQIFTGGPNSHGSVIDADGEYLVYHVLDITPAADAPDKNIADYLTNSLRDSLYAQFIQGLTDDYGIKVNQQAMNQVLNLTPAQ
jgi:peptidyl-prolyl cis-trans isomerase D